MTKNDKIRGTIVGSAFGDALGLGTEFMTKAEVAHYYPGGLRHFKEIIRDAHRCQWEPGEWTNDTEINVRLLESGIEGEGFHIHRMAQKFKTWYDETDVDVSPVYRAICNDPDWLAHPITTTHRIWHESGILEASNEAAQRSMVAALLSDSASLMENTRKLTLMTNDDSRCVATSMVLSQALFTLLNEDRVAGFDELDMICRKIDRRTEPWLEMAWNNDLSGMNLEDEDSMGWTRKAMGSAMWALWHCDTPQEAYDRLIAEGGDADTNCGIAGGLIGAKFGYDALPEEKKNLLRHDYLLDLSDRVEAYRKSAGL